MQWSWNGCVLLVYWLGTGYAMAMAQLSSGYAIVMHMLCSDYVKIEQPTHVRCKPAHNQRTTGT